MRVALGADHNGFGLKQEMVEWLAAWGHETLDLGAAQLDPVDDYPDYAEAVSEAVTTGRADRGILVCGSGVGASLAANKARGVRAGMCHDTYSARQGVEHDDMNVLCLGTRVIGPELAKELVQAFLAARFTGEERHRRRLQKIQALEERNSASPPAGGGG